MCGSWHCHPAPESDAPASAPGALWQQLHCTNSTTVDWAAQGVTHEGIAIQTTETVLGHAVEAAQRELVQLLLM